MYLKLSFIAKKKQWPIKKMDSECPICKSSLGHPQFAPSADDHEESSDVFRLRCGHAFHNGCLCRSLRTTAGCPMCRSGPEREDLRIVVDTDGLLTIQTGDLSDVESAADFNLAEARLVSETLTSVGRAPQVQKARASVNEATREYRKVEQHLFRARCDFLKTAIDDFRGTWRSPFEKVRRNLKRKLRSLKAAEKEEVAKVLPDVDLDAYINYDVEPHVGNNDTFGPLKHSFWKH